MLPNFIIAGATRSGTTSLYNYLIQHPDIKFPKLKEPRYFSSIDLRLPQNGPGDETVDKKLILTQDQYEDLYRDIGGCARVGDASSEYLYHYQYSARHIIRGLGDIPIIVILRNPVERAFSAYNNLVRDGREIEKFENALRLEDKRISDNWDMMWHYKHVGLYYRQVKRFKELFTDVKVIVFEEFVNNKRYWVKEILEFLGVATDYGIDVSIAYSHSGKPRNKVLSLLTDRRSKYIYPIRDAIIKHVPRKYLEYISAKMLVKEEMCESTRQYLKNIYREDVRSLEGLIEKDLQLWGI